MHEVAIAILHRHGQFLMQLRDDLPNILYPGHWALFGGHQEPGESPDLTIQRELWEEIHYVPPTLTKFDCYLDINVIRHVYVGILAVELDRLSLHEGQDMDLLSLEDIQTGSHYSRQIHQRRPLGRPHRQIMLDFVHHQSFNHNLSS